MKKHFIKVFMSAIFLCTASFGLHAQIKIEAEAFSESKSLSSKIIFENDGTTVGYFDEKGETLTYEVNIPEDGLYKFSFKYLSGEDGRLEIGTENGNFALFKIDANKSTAWWETPISNWNMSEYSSSALFSFSAGKQRFTVKNLGIGINLDYFEIQLSPSKDNVITKIISDPTKVELLPGEKIIVTAAGFNSSNEAIAAPVKWSSNAPDGYYVAPNQTATEAINVTIGEITKDIRVNIIKATKKQEFVVTKHGKLNTNNGAVRDSKGNKISLMGPSFFWSCSAPLWWCKETVDYLVSEYNVQIIRLPVSIAPGDNTWSNPENTWNTKNYLHSREYTIELVDKVVRAAIENDIYVIIDFHEHYAHMFPDLAKDFFTYFATKWKDYPNIMYEIYNEPITGNSDVISYAKEIIPVIRNIDKDNVIIVGSTRYSREPHNVTSAGDGHSNIAYTWHGYVEYGHQDDWNGNSNWNNGVPIVVTEWGLNWSKNDAGLINLYKDKQVINAFWAMNNKGDDDGKWSILKSGCTKVANWQDSEMTENGAYLLNVTKNWINYSPVLIYGMQDLKLEICDNKILYMPENKTTIEGIAEGGSENYSYTWAQVSGPSKASISNQNNGTTLVEDLMVGKYIFSLTVSDDNDIVEKEVSITIYEEGYTDPGLIDDIEDNNIISLWGGSWRTFNDSDKNANPYSNITNADDLPKNGIIDAQFTLGNKWQGDGWMGDPYCGVELYLKADKNPVDLSSCNKITYKFKGADHEFRTCMEKVKDSDYHSVNISGSNDWKTVTVEWSSLTQAPDWGIDMSIDKKDISKFSWQIKGAAGNTGAIQLDDITCVGASSPTAVTEILVNNVISIYPNPIKINENCVVSVPERCLVRIYSIAGTLVKEFVAIPNSNNYFKITNSGIYIIKTEFGNSKLIVL